MEGRLVVAGSLRRRKAAVGDVELVYVPRRVVVVAGDFFEVRKVAATDAAIEELVRAGVLERRLNRTGAQMYGEQNKLMRHVGTGMPVDLFATTEESWWNYLVCRTGSAENNVQIAEAARRKGWVWKPYGSGFVQERGTGIARVRSEREVFAFVGMEWREPWER
jgi:DNA polymerase/3'-5' exonuclease PolX